jgi:hypothetical protein
VVDNVAPFRVNSVKVLPQHDVGVDVDVDMSVLCEDEIMDKEWNE